ncbi:unnamed protein product [Adineta steineri]|uniref:Protein sleepless n=1 Tax=Adineta steineri TaxID=433720 RepID=A0A820G5G5_9BILA|nr:unnamed protein product [Adineta steineri]CAF4270610.1 unnamed protein product [Adineta steineri]
MLMKGSLFLFFTILFLQCMNIECQKVQCYSCSDCANSTLLSQMDSIVTTDNNDQCIKTTIFTGGYNQGYKIISRGASSNCVPYTNNYISIFCCKNNFCNA